MEKETTQPRNLNEFGPTIGQQPSETAAKETSPRWFSPSKWTERFSNGKARTAGALLGMFLLGGTVIGAGEYAYLKQTGKLDGDENVLTVQNIVSDKKSGEACPPAPECKPEEKKLTFEKATGTLNWGRFLRIVGVVDNAPVINENDPIYKEYKDKGIDISAICFLKVPGQEKAKGAGPKFVPTPTSGPAPKLTEQQKTVQVDKDSTTVTGDNNPGAGANQTNQSQIEGDNNTVNQINESCVVHGDNSEACVNKTIIEQTQPTPEPTKPPEPTPTPKKEDTERPESGTTGGPPPTKW
ncbi:MAG TPA: hypothetical protein VJ179_02040 [Patescibacteria group bacterium]|nr:hypothetical protein [Patescibacteria group bacterium]